MPGPSVVHAGGRRRARAHPLPGPVLAAPYHLTRAADSSPYAYGRDANPDVTTLEQAIALDGGETVSFAWAWRRSRRSCSPAAARPTCWWRRTAARHWRAGRGAARPAACTWAWVDADQAALVTPHPARRWCRSSTPSNPGLRLSCDLRAVANAAHATGALLAVDDAVATPLGMQPLALGADIAVTSATKLVHWPFRHPARPGQRARRRAGHRPARVALADGWDRRPVRGLARAPVAVHARPAAGALLRQRAGRGRGAARACRRDRRPPPRERPGRGRPDGSLRADWSASRWPRRMPPRRSWPRAPWSPRPRASAGSSRRPSAAGGGGPTRCPTASSASRPAARTRPTWWPTSWPRSTRSRWPARAGSAARAGPRPPHRRGRSWRAGTWPAATRRPAGAGARARRAPRASAPAAGRASNGPHTCSRNRST